MQVKTWKPAKDCPACQRAAQLFDLHTRVSAETNSKAIKRIRDLEAEVKQLRKENIAMKEQEKGDAYSTN